MKVTVLKDFLVAVDSYGVKTRSLVAGTVDEVDDDIAQSLVDEGYVSLMAGSSFLAGDIVEPLVEVVASAVEIPADWQNAHHKTRVALAKKLGAPADITADKADQVIAAEIARRAGE